MPKPKTKVCYRCGVILDQKIGGRPPVEGVEYMRLDYCVICREIVVAMARLIVVDPPFGFPGAKGYLEPDPVVNNLKL